MPPHEITGMSNSVRPNRRYFMAAENRWGLRKDENFITDFIRAASKLRYNLTACGSASLAGYVTQPMKVMPKSTVFSSTKALTSAIFALLVTASAPAADSTAPKKYDSGYHTMARITEDLYRALPVEKRREFMATPVLLEKIKVPYLEPGEYSKN